MKKILTFVFAAAIVLGSGNCGLFKIDTESIAETSTGDSGSGGSDGGGSTASTTNDTGSTDTDSSGNGGKGDGGDQGGSSTTTSSTGGAGGQGGSGGEGGSVMPPEQKLFIELALDTPESTIVVAGKDIWVHYSSYYVTNITDDLQQITEAEIAQGDPNGDAADFTALALARGGVVCLSGSQVLQVGNEQHFLLDQTDAACDFSIPPLATVLIEVWAKTAAVQPSSAVGGAWKGVSRSGHKDSLRLKGLAVASDPSDILQGAFSNENPPFMVLRKTKPTITKHPLSTHTLANLQMDLIKFQVSADGAGSLGDRHHGFYFIKTQGLSALNFRVRRGASDMDLASYTVWKYNGSVFSDSILSTDTMGYLTIDFTNEETIAGSGHVYTLYAQIDGAVSGQSFEIGFGGNFLGFSVVLTDCLTEMTPSLGFQPSYVDKTIEPLTWSDLSESPHSDQLCNQGGSIDWTNAYLVQDLTGSEILSVM